MARDGSEGVDDPQEDEAALTTLPPIRSPHADGPVGSLAWLARTQGRCTFSDRLRLVLGALSTLEEGVALAWRARRSPRRGAPLDALEPPDTLMVGAARAYLDACAGAEMRNHCYRTAFWTAAVLYEHEVLDDTTLETAWVAALLHDVGLEVPPARGDFSVAGVQAVAGLAQQLGWSAQQTYEASEAIACNLSTGVDRRLAGKVGWAMNVGGLGELGFFLHRAQMHPDRLAELEARYPREGFRAAADRLIREEAERVPDGRFAFLGRFFPLIMRA